MGSPFCLILSVLKFFPVLFMFFRLLPVFHAIGHCYLSLPLPVSQSGRFSRVFSPLLSWAIELHLLVLNCFLAAERVERGRAAGGTIYKKQKPKPAALWTVLSSADCITVANIHCKIYVTAKLSGLHNT